MTQEKQNVDIEPLELAKKAREAVADKMGENIQLIDVREITTITDYYLVVSGSSAPHIKALYGHVLQELKSEGIVCYRKSGDPAGGWLLIDYIDVIIHIFSRESRDYYQIEDLWVEAPRIE
jgi:ribosome-associated protein